MAETTERVEGLEGQLEKINLAIRAKEEIVRRVRELSDRCESQSDLGWFLSMLAGDAGTIFAVCNGRTARDWDSLARRLQEDILLLKVDRKILQSQIDQRERAQKS